MYTSAEYKRKPAGRIHPLIIYLGISLFCFIVYFIYNMFSHGVTSPFMTFLFAWPLVIGALPCALISFAGDLPRPGYMTVNLYNSGLAAVTVSSLLKGIFDIAGTASIYQSYLMYGGFVLLAVGIAFYVRDFFRN